jgi:hypothetical protein
MVKWYNGSLPRISRGFDYPWPHKSIKWRLLGAIFAHAVRKRETPTSFIVIELRVIRILSKVSANAVKSRILLEGISWSRSLPAHNVAVDDTGNLRLISHRKIIPFGASS